jgi:hypothetical protein
LHPFIDGNKRTAVSAASLLLRRNGFEVVAATVKQAHTETGGPPTCDGVGPSHLVEIPGESMKIDAENGLIGLVSGSKWPV